MLFIRFLFTYSVVWKCILLKIIVFALILAYLQKAVDSFKKSADDFMKNLEKLDKNSWVLTLFTLTLLVDILSVGLLLLLFTLFWVGYYT